jgi:teichuronic acid biosynthesis glycosyltransferase TuaG
MPRTSVIMPAHNSQRTLAQSIQSVLGQTDGDWELLVVDDGSLDDSPAILRHYAKLDPRIRVTTHDRALGAARARNNAIGQARGRYIAFLDSDDLWMPEKLERQLAHMCATGAALGYTAYSKIDFDDSEPDLESSAHARVVVVPSALTYTTMLRQNYIGCLTAVYDREVVGKVYMPEIALRQDYALWLRILRSGHKAFGLNESLALYRANNKDSLSANKLRNVLYTWQLYRKLERLPLPIAVQSWISYVYGATRKSLI